MLRRLSLNLSKIGLDRNITICLPRWLGGYSVKPKKNESGGKSGVIVVSLLTGWLIEIYQSIIKPSNATLKQLCNYFHYFTKYHLKN